MSDPEDHSLKLIETIYRTALDPSDYDTFMARWNDWMTSRMAAIEELRATEKEMSAPEVAAHFELALRLIERLQEHPREGPNYGPQMLINASGAILWKNTGADRLFGHSNGHALHDMNLSSAHRDAVDKFLNNLAVSAQLSPTIIQLSAASDARPVAFRVEPMQEGQSEPLALLTALAPGWPPAMGTLLADTHRLSPGEIEVCALLAQGRSPAGIADDRATSIATVRTQIKKILSKTRTASQPELVAHLHAMMRMAEQMPEPATQAALPRPHDGRVREIALRDRKLVVEEHGAPDGRPVIFVHGMLDGTGVTKTMDKALYDRNLRFICPHRPAFGMSDPSGVPAAKALDNFGRDMRDLTDLLALDPPVLVGHMAGALYAVAAAETCEARAIVNISGGVPILSTAQFETMSRRQRLVAFTALYAPAVLPFVVNAGIRQIRSGGIETFMQSLYESAPVDRAVLEREDVRALVLDGYQFTVRQGHEAFATDSHHVVRDWTAMFERTAPAPVHLIHGTHDPVVGIESVRDFARKYAERVTLSEVTDAGQLVFYQTPDRVLDTIAAAFDDDGARGKDQS